MILKKTIHGVFSVTISKKMVSSIAIQVSYTCCENLPDERLTR